MWCSPPRFAACNQTCNVCSYPVSTIVTIQLHLRLNPIWQKTNLAIWLPVRITFEGSKSCQHWGSTEPAQLRWLNRNREYQKQCHRNHELGGNGNFKAALQEAHGDSHLASWTRRRHASTYATCTYGRCFIDTLLHALNEYFYPVGFQQLRCSTDAVNILFMMSWSGDMCKFTNRTSDLAHYIDPSLDTENISRSIMKLFTSIHQWSQGYVANSSCLADPQHSERCRFGRIECTDGSFRCTAI